MKSFSSLLCCLLLAVSAAGCWVPALPDDTLFSCDTNADCAQEGMVCVPRAGLRGFCCTSAAEVCNGVDDDCNGVKDDLANEPCYGGPADKLGVGECREGHYTCAANGQRVCSGEGQPTTEACNGKDDDCDGETDEGFNLQTDMANCGSCGNPCNATSQTCVDGACKQRAELDCGNGADDDGDGNKDCADLVDCTGKLCGPTCLCINGKPGEGLCSDGADNDGDNDADCADLDCDNRSCGAGCLCALYVKTELDCADGQNNDGNQGTDCADIDCNLKSCGSFCVCEGSKAVEKNCSDGNDNDNDGLKDCADTVDCPNYKDLGDGSMCVSAKRVEVACSDTTDNDKNGPIDCVSGNADANCVSGSCGPGCSFVNCTKKETVCNDGLDNDGTEGIDCADKVDCPTNTTCRRSNGTAGKCLANGTCG